MYDAEAKGSVNYLNLAREILQHNNMLPITDELKSNHNNLN
jgi:hypothetical protein